MKSRGNYVDVGAEQFAAKLRTVRQEYGLTQNDLAKSLGVTRVHIIRLESGKARPTIMLVKLLSLMYNYNYEWLCDNVGDDQKYPDELPFR